jgi:uncharacterized membrane protein
MSQKGKAQINKIIDLKQVLFILAWGVILGLGIFRNFQHIFILNLIYYTVSLQDSGIYDFIKMALSATGIISLTYFLYIKYQKNQNPASNFNRACMPLLLLLPEALFPVSIISPICFTMICGIVLLRYFSLFTYQKGIYQFSKKYIVPLILLLVFLLFSSYGYYLQRCDLLGMRSFWGDWGYTVGPLLNTLEGKWFYSDYYGYNIFQIHFSPGIVLLGPAVWFFNSLDVFFFTSSLILFSGGLVLYLLARQLKMSQTESLIIAFIAFITPGIINMNLSIYYGFHEIYPAIPLVFLSFLFYEKKNYPIAIAMFLLSMSFKETVPVLWLGFGAVFILKKKFKLALFLIIFSLAYYLFVHEIMYPWLRDGQEYWNLFRYKHLGNSMGEIALSPFTRPAEFWGSLVRPGCLLFVWLLLLPFIIIIPRNPLLSGAGGIVLMFICLQGSSELQNIMMQYQAMPLIAILLNMLYNFHCLKDSKTDNNAWTGFLLYGLRDRNNKEYFSATLLATLGVCILCLFFFAQHHFSKNPPASSGNNIDVTKDIDKFKRLIPPGIPVTVSPRTAPQLVFRNKLRFELEADKWEDYVFFVLNDSLFESSMNQLRNKLEESKDYHFIMGRWAGAYYLQLYGRNAPVAKKRLLKNMSQNNWRQLAGISMNTKEKDFQIKIQPELRKNRIKFYLRLAQKVKYDMEINVTISNKQRTLIFRRMFNNGIFSATVARKGDVFIFYMHLPDNFDRIRKILWKVIKINMDNK